MTMGIMEVTKKEPINWTLRLFRLLFINALLTLQNFIEIQAAFLYPATKCGDPSITFTVYMDTFIILSKNEIGYPTFLKKVEKSKHNPKEAQSH